MTAKLLRLTLCVAVVAIVVSCGFGFGDDSGNPIPGADYWGWQCWDGGDPDPDAGCPPPGPCDDSTYPSLGDGGGCLCDNGTALPDADCGADAG